MSESPNRTPQIDPVRQEIINKFPELRKFQNESPRRFEARATMLAELVAIKKNPSSKLGYIDNTDKTMQIIDRVIQNLKSNPTPSAIGDTIVLSTLGGKLGVLPVHQTTRVFLGRLLNDAKLLNDFFSESKERVPHDAEIEKQISRLGRVLVAFEQHHPDKEYKTVLRQTYALLDAGNLDGAKEKIRSTLQEYNIDVSSIVGDSQGCMNALRALGAMSDASQMGVSEMKGKLEGIDITPQQTKFKKFLEKNFQSTMPTSTVQAKAQIDVAMNALPDRSPQKIRLFQAGNGAIQTMAEEIAYMKCFDAFIAQNGSE